jgi:hypothetical protein
MIPTALSRMVESSRIHEHSIAVSRGIHPALPQDTLHRSAGNRHENTTCSILYRLIIFNQ